MFSSWKIGTKSHDFQWYIVNVGNSINIMEICWQDPTHSLHWRMSRSDFDQWIDTRLHFLDYTHMRKIPNHKLNSKRFCWPKTIPKGLKREIQLLTNDN